ncbi:facilitator of iron transport 2-like isoform X2 [Homarus americanus]|uniref:facilitator of iron transport 2-like isoform X2 n=1 Tax=Homarus americanus TaxID=6706 RepID=UPI001C4619CF|nr:facilitator of iron transport 2-like isoform X2 [Homarus americanus]
MGVASVVVMVWAWLLMDLALATPYGAHWNHQPSYSSNSQGCATNVHHVTKIVGGGTVTETATETVTEVSAKKTITQITTKTVSDGTVTQTITKTVSKTTTAITLTTTTKTVTSTTAAATATTTVTEAGYVTVTRDCLLDPRYEESALSRSSLDNRSQKNHRTSGSSSSKGWAWSS